MAKNAVTDWSTSAASNTDVGGIGIQGSSNISSGDNSFREIMAQIATQFGKLNAKGADLASGSVDLSTATGAFVHITGTTTITALGTVTAGRVFRLEFDGALTLTHNGTSLILPGAANIITAAGDTAEFISEGSGNWRLLTYQRAAGAVQVGKGTDVASGSTVSLGEGNFFHITGTTTITDIDFANAYNGRWAILEFDAALTLTHNSTTLVIPGGANITTAAGDICMVVQDSGDNVHVVWYQKAAIGPLGRRAPDIVLKNLRTTNNTGGASSGSWTRDTLGINVESRDVNNECSLSSNLFTLSAGTWYIEAHTSIFAVNGAQLLLYNTTDGAIVSLDGGAGYGVAYAFSGGNYSNFLQIEGVFTVAAGKALALQCRAHTAQGSGYGPAVDPGADICHQVVKLWRL